jgi:TRAP-type transport system periplasmic protein
MQSITLKLAPISDPAPRPEGSFPPPAGNSRFWGEWIKMISAKTGGQVIIEAYWSQTLSSVNQIVNNTSIGVCDIGGVSPAKQHNELPLSLVAQLPGFGDNSWALLMAFWDLMNQEPLLSEYTQYNILPLGVNLVADYYLISTKPICTLADLRGKKISCTGFIADTLAALGAIPVGMVPQEQYEGMQKGTIDGISAGYAPIIDLKFYEVAKYITNFAFGSKAQPILINKNSWNKLPADIQTIFRNTIPDSIQICIESYYRKGEPLFPMSDKLMKDYNLQIIQPTAEDIAALYKIQAGQATAWVTKTEKEGLPGARVLADYRVLLDKYTKISNFTCK